MTIDDEVEALVKKHDLLLVISALGRYALYKENSAALFRELNRVSERAADRKVKGKTDTGKAVKNNTLRR